jgi:tRNA(His) 5'-end guanylyltransferase
MNTNTNVSINENKQEIKQNDVNELDAGSKIALGERMKFYEKLEFSHVPPYQPFLVRVDGNCFSKYTSAFPKPFDLGFSRAMINASNELLKYFNARTVFVCSDEITLIFSSVCSKNEYDDLISNDGIVPTHIYAGRRSKIESLVAAKATSLFNNFMNEEIDVAISLKGFGLVYLDSAVQRVRQREAIFDARMILFPVGNEIEIVNNIIWRSSYDCYRNTVTSYGRYIFGDKVIRNKNCGEIIEMMKEKAFDFSSQVPFHYKYGTFCKKIAVKMVNDKGEEYMRSKSYNFCVNLIDKNRSSALELFFDKYYSDKIECIKTII